MARRQLPWNPAITRCGVAVAVLMEVVEARHTVASFAKNHTLHLSYSGRLSDALTPLAGLLLPLWIIGAVLLAIGVVPRLSAAITLFGIGGFLVADKQNYSNHVYLFCCLLLIFAVCGGLSSRSPSRDQSFLTLALSVQMTFLYGFAALNKFVPSYLSGDSLVFSLHAPLYTKVLHHVPHATLLLAVLSAVTELILAIAPWTTRIPRAWALALSGLFHLMVLALVSPSLALLSFGLASFVSYWAALSSSARVSALPA